MQILDALVFCHGLAVVHRDIKLGNILFDERRAVKLADFGFSTVIQASAIPRGRLWHAPGLEALSSGWQAIEARLRHAAVHGARNLPESAV